MGNTPANLHWETQGPKDGVPVLLIHGLGCNVRDWSPQFVDNLIRNGARVMMIDNRDVGRSQRFENLGRPPILWAVLAHALHLPAIMRPKARYTLSDMAADVAAGLRKQNIGKVHVVGVSMGGMIAQRLAIEFPTLVRSLTSIMSSSGAPGLSNPDSEVTKMLTTKPGKSKDVQMNQALAFRRLIAGDAVNGDLLELDNRVKRSWTYGNPAGAGGERQYFAILSDRSRAFELPNISCPTTVIHGEKDPFVRNDHGRDTAQRITGARYVEIAGMGHEILRSNSAKVAAAVLEAVGLKCS